MSSNSTHAARVSIATADDAPFANTSSVRVRHHRTPRVEWSVDRATGGHILHLALAQCVFNNTVRLAHERGVGLAECHVTADGEFNEEGTASTGMTCAIELSGHAPASELEAIAQAAFDDSSVAAILRQGAPVELTQIRALTLPGPDAQTA
jgi:uncharacterized OsmC-like protein